jgi:hypothetical protein
MDYFGSQPVAFKRKTNDGKLSGNIKEVEEKGLFLEVEGYSTSLLH